MTAALIIASGKRSNRDSFEPGQKIGTISAIKRIVLLFQRAGIKEIVVCGEEEKVKKLVPSMNVVFVPCPEDGEMLEYIQLGISYLQKKASEILITHVNIPLFSVHTISALLAAEGEICIPSCHGKRGHPVLLREGSFSQILEYRGGNGLRAAIEACGHPETIVEVDDVGIWGHTPQLDETALISNHDAGRLRLNWRFRIGKEENFYGPGIHQLLHLIDELHSLSDACRYMGISYSKGRKMIQTVEEQMKFPVLITQQGGRGGGYSQLTSEAKRLISCYDAFLQDAEGVLLPLFAKHFGSIK